MSGIGIGLGIGLSPLSPGGGASDPIAEIEALFGANTKHWLADDVAVGALTSWVDRLQSVNLNVVAGDPQIQENGTTGRREADFDGDDSIRIESFTVAQPFTVGVVCKPRTSASNEVIIGGKTTTAWRLMKNASDLFNVTFGSSLSSDAALTAAYTFLAAVGDGASSELWINGVLDKAGNAGTNGLSAERLVFGESGALSLEMTGQIAAVFIDPSDNAANLLAIHQKYDEYYGGVLP